MRDSPEGRAADAYLETIERIEPSIHPIDLCAAASSIAISLKRMADAAEKANTLRMAVVIGIMASVAGVIGALMFMPGLP